MMGVTPARRLLLVAIRAAALVCALAACGPAGAGSSLPVRADLPDQYRILTAEVTLGTHGNAVAAARDSQELREAWTRLELSGDPPRVDFDGEVVLIYAAAHADCPYALVSFARGETLPPVRWVTIERIGDDDSCPVGLEPGEFWRHLTVEQLAQEQGIQPISDVGVLRDDEASEEEIDAYLAALGD
jgi:hypothetical protein